MKGGMLQGDEWRRREATETEGGVHSSGILLGWSIFAAGSVATIDVNTVSDPSFGKLPQTGPKPQQKRLGEQHVETVINGYFCMRRQRDIVYFVK